MGGTDHRQVVANLPPGVSQHLTARQDRDGLLRLAAHGALILTLGTAIALRVPLWWALLPVQGVCLCFLFTLQHECTHKTPFATGALNEWVGRIAGFLILQPFEWFRYFHLAHHRHTNIEGRDPELLFGAKPEGWRRYLWHVSGLPYWTGMAGLVVANAAGRATGGFLPTPALPRIRTEARVMLGGYALAVATLFWSPFLICVWALPLLLGQPFLRLYLLAEHGRCALVANMFENTRTTFTTGLVRFLAWNMPYHTEHHVFPGVPFHKLPELHLYLRDHLKVTAPGYAAFTRDYVAEFDRTGRH